MRKVLSTIAILVTSVCATAQIACQPGQLSKLVTDNAVKTLTIAGQIDARDFMFIASQLHDVETIDMSNVEIVAYEDLTSTTIGNEHTFAAATIPTLSFASKKYLTSVTLPAGTTAICQAAFADCPALTHVNMGDQLTTIGDYAFTACTSLATIELPASVSMVGTGAFSRCTALQQCNVATTGTAAEALTIGNEAFIDCPALTTAHLGQNVTTIGDATFAGTGLTVVDLAQYNKLRTLGNWIYALTHVSTATLPSSLTAMGWGAFVYSDHLSTAILPQGLDMLGDYTFAGNSALLSIDLGNVKTIGNYALYSTTALQEVTIPERTTHIGTRAMAGMTALTQLASKATTAPTLGEEVWQGVDQHNTRLAVPQTGIASYQEAEQWKEFIVGFYSLLGDVDEDLVLTVQDVNLMINILRGLITNYPKQSDTDNDNLITISDINYDINVFLGRMPWSYTFVTPNTTDNVSINNFEIAPGATRDIDLLLTNDEACSHMQCDIYLPEGLSVVAVDKTSRASDHTIVSDFNNGNLRLMCYSMGGNPLSGNCGAIASLKIKADDTFAGNATITVNNVVMAHAINAPLFAAETTATVSTPTGIDEITPQGKAYGAGNTLVIETPTHGVAHIVSMNGTMTTVDVAAGRNEYQPGAGIYVVRLAGKSFKIQVN